MKPPILQSLEITQVNWLPIARAFIEQIELESIIDRLVIFNPAKATLVKRFGTRPSGEPSGSSEQRPH